MKSSIIVGGGLIGLLLARELALSGVEVTVVERGKLAQESSWAGGGILSPLYPWRYPEPVTALASWSQRHFAELTADIQAHSGIDPEFIQSGLLILTSEEGNEAQAWGHQHDVELLRVSAAQANAIEPQLGIKSDGLWLPQIGQIRNPRLLQALIKACDRLGVRFREDSPVEQLIIEDGRILGVKIPAGEYGAESVVVAGGAWSQQIISSLGTSLEVEPVKGQMLLYNAEPDLLQRIVLVEGHYVIPRRDGHILVGSTLEYAGFDKSPTEEARQELQAAAEKIIPALREYPIVNHWAGLRPGSPDGIPYIGQHPSVANLFVSAGHFRNGVAMGPASARLLVDLMLQREPILDPNPYAING